MTPQEAAAHGWGSAQGLSPSPPPPMVQQYYFFWLCISGTQTQLTEACSIATGYKCVISVPS